MKKLFKKKNVEAVNKSETVNVSEIKNEINEEELIAVLTAAVAACLNTSTYKLNIKSFKRVKENIPAWNNVSRIENIQNCLY